MGTVGEKEWLGDYRLSPVVRHALGSNGNSGARIVTSRRVTSACLPLQSAFVEAGSNPGENNLGWQSLDGDENNPRYLKIPT